MKTEHQEERALFPDGEIRTVYDTECTCRTRRPVSVNKCGEVMLACDQCGSLRE